MGVYVKFENYSGSQISGMKQNGNRFLIPGHSIGKKAIIVEFPSLEIAEAKIENITKRHKTVKASLVEVEEGGVTAPLVPESGEVTEEDSIPAEDGGDENEEDVDGGDYANFEAFLAAVETVEEGRVGWWSVKVSGVDEPIKVRNATDKDNAILLAFEKTQATAIE